MRRLPPLSALSAFEATVRLGSVTAAAAELGRTHSAISKQLRHIADDLGVELFLKDGVGLVPTAEAIELAGEVAEALNILDAARRRITSRRERANQLRVICSATLAIRWLVPRLPRFYAEHPEVEVNLILSQKVDAHADREFDVILSGERTVWPMESRRSLDLGHSGLGLVVSPDHRWRRLGRVIEADLRIDHSTFGTLWDIWGGQAGYEVQGRQIQTFPHMFLGLEAAVAGGGVSLAEIHYVIDDLVSGRLEAPFGFQLSPGGFKAVLPASGGRKKSTERFLGWIADQLHETEDATNRYLGVAE